MKISNNLRKEILKMIYNAKEGHLPSSFSIVDIINNLYSFHLRNMKSKKFLQEMFCIK